MKRKKVESSNIASVGYNSRQKILEVAFLPSKPSERQAVYQYKNVPPEVARGLDQAESKGKYLAANVKNKYPYERVED